MVNKEGKQGVKLYTRKFSGVYCDLNSCLAVNALHF